MPFEKIFVRDSCIHLGKLSDGIPKGVGGPLTALLPAFSEVECKIVLSTIPALVENGCASIACIGPFAEKLHDDIDYLLEDMHRGGTTTTWHTDANDACEYFVFCATSLTPTLLALVANHAALADAIKQTIVDLNKDLN